VERRGCEEILWARTAPFTEFHRFARSSGRSEPPVGWLWWWVEPSGRSFGMLTHALRHHATDDGQWGLDLDDVVETDVRALSAMAQKYRIPLVLLIFGGFSAEPAVEASVVSVLPAIELRRSFRCSPSDAARRVGERAIPLGSLIADEGSADVTRQIADRLLRTCVTGRDAEQSRVWFEWAAEHPGSALPGVPLERVGDFGMSYDRSIFQGLRPRPPRYVDDREPGIRSGAAGIAITRTERS
jgi:hypothetical protein